MRAKYIPRTKKTTCRDETKTKNKLDFYFNFSPRVICFCKEIPLVYVMEQSAKIVSVDYNYDTQIPYDSKVLWVYLQRNTTEPLSLQIGTKARIVNIDHEQGPSIKTVVIKDVMGSSVALKDSEYVETRDHVTRDSYLLW